MVEDLDMYSAEVGEAYSNSKIKEYCLGATNEIFSIAFRECFKRSSHLISKNFHKITEIGEELSLQE